MLEGNIFTDLKETYIALASELYNYCERNTFNGLIEWYIPG